MRADRLLALVLLLQSRGRLTAGQLATQLEVSVRTIYRDVVALGTAGIPVVADAMGYRLVDGYRTQLTGLTPQEARGLALAGLPAAAAELGLASAVTSGELKLTAALPQDLREQATRMRQRFHVDAPGWYRDGDGSDHLSGVAEAVWAGHAIQVRYESWRGSVHRRLEPYGLVLKAGVWYLVARCGADLRVYKVSQIQELMPLPDAVEVPARFDLAAHWRVHLAEFRRRLYQGDALVRLACSAIDQFTHVFGRAAEQAIATAAPSGDGCLTVRLPIESLTHAEEHLLRLGARVEILEPAALRERIHSTARALATLYGS